MTSKDYLSLSKSVCQLCGTINSVDGMGAYDFNRNVYGLNACDNNFFLDFDATTYNPYNATYHTTVLKKGQYCQFCKGTRARATQQREYHDFTETIDGQLGNSRFFVSEHCDDCGYETSEYITAKAVVSSYYGTEDGNAHSVTISDLSDDDVHTRVRYGTSAGNCNLTSAPSYTEAGYYPVYYEIDYRYGGESMTENGVSHVWLMTDASAAIESKETTPTVHEHDYRYVETVSPSCTNLGYENWQCDGCGRLEKRNYTQSIGHNYKAITIREASCKQTGLKLYLCDRCGDFYEETTPLTSHHYHTETHNPTCRITGYTDHICDVCGDNYITNITPTISHSFERVTKVPTCIDRGYTTSTCSMCGFNFVSDYTEPTGHSWDSGHTVTGSTCTSEGVIEYNCTNSGCTEKMIKATSATGHTPGTAATCTEPQKCTVCDTVLELPTGHHYHSNIVAPTCTAMGYTVYTCDCGDIYVGDYTDKTEHDYNAVITNSTCTSHGFTTYTCEDCGHSYISDYMDKLPHDYVTVVTAPTCTAMGYTTYTCADCGDTHKADYIEMIEHNYNRVTTEPTCTEHGYSVYTCPDCGKEYIGDYTDVAEHNYVATITAPTCTEMGYTTYVCSDCGDSYKSDYTDKIPHNYNAVITVPTCTAFGYTTYTCSDCGNEYVSYYAEKSPHNYVATVTEPTCTSSGLTTYVCSECDVTYISDYTDKLTHNYVGSVTAPTCLELGFTTFICSDCGDTYKAEYAEALGHTPSDWIVDVEATIEHSGEKHIECEACGETLQTVTLSQLVDRDFTDEDGNASVGAYSIKVYDKNNMPVWNAEITIDVTDNVLIKLPDGRLLDFSDQTTIKATKTETGEPKEGLAILTIDKNGNNATGNTDADGILRIPNNQSSTGDDNGTIGEEDNTFVVTVTDKANVIIADCDIYIGESNNIVVDLPDGIRPTMGNPVIVTVSDHNGEPQKDITVIALGSADYIERGTTDIYGKITLPMTSEGFTDENGKVNVDNINVIVNDETGLISNAYVVHNEDGTISVTLPDNKTISYANRITVTVLDSMGVAITNMNVTVKDIAENAHTASTDENGRIVVPPLTEDMTDNEGRAVVSGYNVLITDESNPIENAFVYIEDGKIFVELPDGTVIDIDNRITATITDADGKPVKDMSVTFKDSADNTETNLTDENGKATVPPTNIDYTDINGYSEVDGLIVTVMNEAGAIEKAFITHNAEIVEGENVTAENISVVLPENVKFDYNNRITVMVLNKAENTPVNNMAIIISELPLSDTEPKVLGGKTNAEGKAVFPSLSEDITDDSGDSSVSEDTTEPGQDTDGDGTIDVPGETVTTTYTVKVNDTLGVITNSFIEIKDGKVFVTLPEDKTLDTSNQTTVTVLDKDNNPVSNVSVTIKDSTTEKTANTNVSGQVILPVKPSSGGSSSGGSRSGGGGGGGSYINTNTTNITVTDKDGKTVSVTKSTDSKGDVTITLPTGKELGGDDYYTIKATDNKGNAKPNVNVALKDKKNNSTNGQTDKNGILILPAKEHKAYIFGYDDGTFRPDNDMTRAEAAAIFARLVSEEKGENISGKSSFADVSANEWHSKYVGYLEKYEIIKGYSDNTFRPDESVTRAEFVAMTVRFHGLFNKVAKADYTVKYTDLATNYWAYADIAFAKNAGWLNGYADGSFKADNNITRAEVVTVVNRATGRSADKEFVNANLTKLNRFTDVKNSNEWFFMDIHEACNDHMGITNADGEIWSK